MSFGSFLGGLERQINPFDHGATFNRPNPQVARTPAPQQARRQVASTPAPRAAQPRFNALSVQPVQRPQLTAPRPVFTPPTNLQVHVAPQQNLQVGNQVVAPAPQAHTYAPGQQDRINQLIHPNLVTQVKQDLGRKLAQPIAAANQTVEMGRDYISRPIAQAVQTIGHGDRAFVPTTNLDKALFGRTPVKPIQQTTSGTYQHYHDSKNPLERALAVPAAAANAGLNVANDVPIFGPALKVATKGVKLGAEAAVPAIKEAGKLLNTAKPLDQAGFLKLPSLNKTTKSVINDRPTPLTDQELAASQKVLNSKAGNTSAMDLTSQDMAHFHNAQVKLGVAPGTPDGAMAVYQALGAHRTFDMQQSQRKLFTPLNQVGGVKPFENKLGAAIENKGNVRPVGPLEQEALKHNNVDEFIKSSKVKDWSNESYGGVNTIKAQIPIDKLKGLVPPYRDLSPGREVRSAVKVKAYTDPADIAAYGQYRLVDGNHRVAQTLLNGGTHIESNVALTKQQLTDIYNQAHAAKPSTPTILSKATQIGKKLTSLNTNGGLGKDVTNPANKIGKKDLAPDLHPQQKEFITQYANMLKDMGQGNGVDILPDGRRVSNNFRSAADKGKRLTNADWFDRARTELESGKGAYGASDEYKAIAGNAPLELPKGFEAPTATSKTAKQPPTVSPPKAKLPTAPKELVSGKALGNDTPKVNVNDYLKQQNKTQELARKAGEPQGFGKIKPHLADAKAKIVDSMAPIEDKLNQRVTASNAASHITPQIDRALRADTIAGQYIKDNGLAKAIQNAPDTKNLDQYLIAKHAVDLESNGVKTGRNLAADKQLVDSLSPKYEVHAQAVKQYSQNLLDKAVDYGLVSKELATHLKEKYPNYVPVQRIFGENELAGLPKGVGGGKASLSGQSVVQKIKGSDRTIESPLNSLIHKTEQVIDQGERNKAAQILTGYKDLEGNPFQLRELAKDETVGNKHVISYLDKGVTRRFETSKEVAAAAKSLNKEQIGLIGQVMAAPVRVLRLGATSLNPAFTLANVAKDSVSGFINSSAPVRSSVANPKVFVAALKASLNHGSKEYGELVREGAGGTSYDIYRNNPTKNVKSIRAQKNAGTQAAYVVTHPAQLFRAAENLIGRSEEFNRALQYYGGKSAASAKGIGESGAKVFGAHSARNNTVNFARGGDWTRVINSSIPYLNAGIQGSRTLIRSLKEHPAQTSAKLALTAFFPVAAVTAWNTSDPTRKAAYDDLKDYVKQGNLVIVPPHPKKDAAGNWNIIKIPVSQEIANLSNIVRQGVESAVHDGSVNLASMLGDLAGTATSLNLGSPRQTLGQVLPQAVKPAIESLTNQNLFTGNPIVSQSKKNLPGRDQIGTNTSGTATTIGKYTGLSPLHIDNFIKSAGGGLSQNVINATDTGLAKAGVIQPGQVKGKSVPDSIKGRFNGGQGSSPYDFADKQFAARSKELQALPGYKSLSTDEKAKALNRLQNSVNGAFIPPKDGTQPKYSQREQALVNGQAGDKVDLNSYLSDQTGGKTTVIAKSVPKPQADFLKANNALTADQRKQKISSDNAYEYNYAVAKYANDTAQNKLSRVQDIHAKEAIDKAKVGAGYSKDVRDVYGLSKADIYTVITTDPNGNKIAADLKAYDQALVDNGIITAKQAKFRYGFGSKVASGGGKRGYSSGRKAKGAKLASYKAPKMAKAPKITAFRTPKLTGSTKSTTVKLASYKTPKSYTIKKPKGVLA